MFHIKIISGTVGPPKSPAIGDLTLGQGTLYSFDLDLSVRSHVHNVGLSNGIAWTNDSATMFFVDSIDPKIYALDYDIEHCKIGKFLCNCSRL